MERDNVAAVAGRFSETAPLYEGFWAASRARLGQHQAVRLPFDRRLRSLNACLAALGGRLPTAGSERVLNLASDPGDLVLDAFVGSGSAAVAAEQQRRRWIAIDLSRFAVHLTRKRLLETQECRPFEILNLGRYERQYWQVATFGDDLDNDGQIALYEYLAFILKLYDASPVSGLSHLHGKKTGAMVHIGAVDRIARTIRVMR